KSSCGCIVVDDQHQWSRAGLGDDARRICDFRGLRLGLPIREHDGECRAFAWLALNRDVAAESLAKTLGDRESESGAAVSFSGGRIGLHEVLEELGQLFGRHPEPCVANDERQRRSLALELERDGAVGREFCRIAQKIEQALLELGAVGVKSANVRWALNV